MSQQFNIIPSNEQLEGLNRDLRFHPVVNGNPQRLTPQQIDDFNRLGFVAPLEAYATDQIAEIRQYFDDLLQRVVQQGGDSYSISSAHLKYGPVYDILTNPQIVDYVADLLGENVIAWGSHFFCKMPHDGKAVAWHQDASYWPLSPSKAVTVWLAIDDADRENACMNFVAGSHHFGYLTFRPSSPDEHNVLNQTIEDPQQYGSIEADVLSAGQFSIHSDLLLHGSEANQSDRRRCGLTLRYCSADVRAELGWNAKGVHVRGSDPSGHWSNQPRPEAS
jgi:non-haem Fe2+, alpha-ketoglutarate-dependent halogenase